MIDYAPGPKFRSIHRPRTRPLWRRRADYCRAACVAIVTALATNMTQCAWSAASDAAQRHYWREWSHGMIVKFDALKEQRTRQ